MKKSVALLIAILSASATESFSAWEPGTRFHIEQVFNKPCLVSPDGRPFKSVGMVWAYGPERGPNHGPLTPQRLVQHLELIQSLGFNTLNLYGDQSIPDMLAWCDEHELAVYFRTAFNDIPGLSDAEREFPDLMDPAFRQKAKDHYRKFLDEIRGHPSVLAVDTDNRWLFPIEWSGALRIDQPKLGKAGLAYFPTWLEKKYGDIGAVNRAWGTKYAAFADIVLDGSALDGKPWRVDVYQYVTWTQADFLRELSAYLKAESGGVLVTATTEHPECIPDTNPPPGAGIDFMSPVHYNTKDDYARDLPALCKLIYETRWHYDMQGGPTYISETGWRTSALEQRPPNLGYAWIEPPDEELAARCYATQFALLDVLPWVSGYGYFMLYDKWPEGDFGYLRDDGTKKPQAHVGDAMNNAFDTAAMPDPAPQVWIYYPDYALATHRPGFQQIKSFVYLWEKSFLDALKARVDQYWTGLRAGESGAGGGFAGDVTHDFQNLWRGFAFTRVLPADDKPIVLLSTVSEILSRHDRKELMHRKTISFGDVGLCDSAMRKTGSWVTDALRLPPSTTEKETRVALDPASGEAEKESAPWWSALPWSRDESWSWKKHIRPAVVCSGQTLELPKQCGKRLELLASSSEGNAAEFCDIEYADGTRQRSILGPTISDARFKPVMTDGVELDGRQWSVVVLPLEPQRELAKLKLPDASWISVCGAAIVSGGVTTNTTVVLQTDKGPIAGDTTWFLSIGKNEESGLNVLQRFANGDPAVVANGSHVAFLYDAVNWGAGTNEISRLVDLHRAWVDEAVNYLEKK